jgi:hypothetical protein
MAKKTLPVLDPGCNLFSRALNGLTTFYLEVTQDSILIYYIEISEADFNYLSSKGLDVRIS